jgi:hypothetical protein
LYGDVVTVGKLCSDRLYVVGKFDYNGKRLKGNMRGKEKGRKKL